MSVNCSSDNEKRLLKSDDYFKCFRDVRLNCDTF